MTPAHDCNYIADREAITLFADSHFPKSPKPYSALTEYGFRHSDEHLYIPHCSECICCAPVMVSADKFLPNRNQKRTWKHNRSLTINRLPSDFNEEHLSLYQRCLYSRHKGYRIDASSKNNYIDFLTSSWSDSYFYEMRNNSVLVCVAVVDQIDNGLSAVYTFFDSDFEKNSLGEFAIIYEIEEVKKLWLQWLYLGYWIIGQKKMKYKTEYFPIEYYINNKWQYFSRD